MGSSCCIYPQRAQKVQAPGCARQLSLAEFRDLDYTFAMMPGWLKHPVVQFVLWTTLFATAYAQSPLFTSNQNLYFLHGFAQAGSGTLNEDWLANTLDPAPLFSMLVRLTLQVFQSEALFYFYYAGLMGIYLFSLLGIAQWLWQQVGADQSPKTESFVAEGQLPDQHWLRRLVLLALLILLHSAGWRFALSRSLGDNWSYVLEDGLADQRMLGPVLQPSSFAVLLALSVLLFLRKKPILAVLAAALAANVHPTYVLSAALLVAAYLLVMWLEKRSVLQPLWVGFSALLGVLPALLYGWWVFWGADPQTTAQAHRILVEFRLPHHAQVGQWFDATALVKIALLLWAVYLARNTSLAWIIGLPALLSAGLTIGQLLTASHSLALLFPWRISILLLPLAMTVILAAGVQAIVNRRWKDARLFARWSERLSWLVIVLAVGIGLLRFGIDLQRKAQIPERGLFNHLRLHHQPGEQYLIPLKMQDFRLASRAPAYVDFKSTPYQDQEVLEWRRRWQLAADFYARLDINARVDCSQLAQLADMEQITHAVLPASASLPGCPQWVVAYRDSAYILYAYVSP